MLRHKYPWLLVCVATHPLPCAHITCSLLILQCNHFKRYSQTSENLYVYMMGTTRKHWCDIACTNNMTEVLQQQRHVDTHSNDYKGKFVDGFRSHMSLRSFMLTSISCSNLNNMISETNKGILKTAQSNKPFSNARNSSWHPVYTRLGILHKRGWQTKKCPNLWNYHSYQRFQLLTIKRVCEDHTWSGFKDLNRKP